jgi:hypothetical protein
MHAMRRCLALAAALAAVAACATPSPDQAEAATTLRAGVGKADVTPRTGFYLGGWTRADRTSHGQHTRLYSRALVLDRAGRKVALVQIDLFMVPGGLVKHIADSLADRGFSEQNILISASHTHSGPGGYANFPTLNTAAPSLATATDPFSFFGLLNPAPADPQLYRFLRDQISTAIRRADDDLAPATAGWGSARIRGLTQNRSLEAHLANHGIEKERGEGSVDDDPGGYEHTIDSNVDVLRVDKVVRVAAPRRRPGRRQGGRRRGGRRGPSFTGKATVTAARTRRIPIGAWSSFPDHGTVTKSSFQFYNADHHASALRVFEKRVRSRGKVPAGQEVLNVYGNSNEGDMSAGLDRHGPAASDYVGRVEAAAMLRAWKDADGDLSRTPELDVRWTRVCFCGQQTDTGQVADQPQVGLPFLTGSEEERGPLFDITGQHYEGTRAPLATGPHGHKIYPPGASSVPRSVPLLAVRVGSRVLASVPGEGTKEVGERIRAEVERAVAGSGVERVVIAGLVNEFVLYFTTPEEYERQHYEGGNTHFGTHSSSLIRQELGKLAGALVRGEPAPAPVEFDPTNGVTPDGPPFGDGAESGTLTEQPQAAYPRLGHATLAWQGGPQGLDRPVDRAFVIVERRVKGRWQRFDSDLGLAMLWEVDDDGLHRARWEVPLSAPGGSYRFRVNAKRYRLVSNPFEVQRSDALVVREAASPDPGTVVVELGYPEPRRDIDLTSRPERAAGGVVTFTVGGRSVRVAHRRGTTFSVAAPAGSAVSVEAGRAADRYGNTSGAAVNLR